MQKVRRRPGADRSLPGRLPPQGQELPPPVRRDGRACSRPPRGDWASACDNRKYRNLAGYGARADRLRPRQRPHRRQEAAAGRVALAADVRAGRQVPALLRRQGLARRPSPTARRINLTAKLGVQVRAGRAATSRATPPPYGVAGWTADDKYVLLYDRYDVWQVAPDGSDAKNLTGGLGRKTQTQSCTSSRRLDDDPAAHAGYRPAKPLLLQAENEPTRDAGSTALEPAARRAQTAHHGRPQLRPAGQGEGRRHLPADGLDLLRLPRLLRHRRRLPRDPAR